MTVGGIKKKKLSYSSKNKFLCWGSLVVESNKPTTFISLQCSHVLLTVLNLVWNVGRVRDRRAAWWPLRLLDVPDAESEPQGLPIWGHGGDEGSCDEHPGHVHFRGLQGGLQEVVWTLQKVHWSWRFLLWGRLEFRVALRLMIVSHFCMGGVQNKKGDQHKFLRPLGNHKSSKLLRRMTP